MFTQRKNLLSFTISVALLGCLQLSAATPSSVSEAIPATKQSASDTFLSAGAGMAILNGNSGWAINFGALKQVTDDANLLVGVDVGLNFWGYSSATPGISTKATGIGLLPTAIYRVRFNKDATFFPYIGASVGPNIFVEKQTSTVAGISQVTSSTKLLVQLLFRPGFYTTLSKVVGLQVEAKLGVLGSDFILQPQASASFAL